MQAFEYHWMGGGCENGRAGQNDARFPLHFSTPPSITSGATLLIIRVWWLVSQFHIYLTLALLCEMPAQRQLPRQPSLLLGHTLVPELPQQLHLPTTAGPRQPLKAAVQRAQVLPLIQWYPVFSREPHLHENVYTRTLHMLHSVFIADSLKVEGIRDLWLCLNNKKLKCIKHSWISVNLNEHYFLPSVM